MSKLFTDSEVFMTKRPTKITQQQEADFSKSVAQEIIKNGWSEEDVEDVAKDISNLDFSDNGYEMAKSLEFDSFASYEIDVQFVEFLDSLPHKKSAIHNKNVFDWVQAHNPQPKFQKGQKLVVETALNYERLSGSVIFVTGFSERSACYLIDSNAERQGGTVIPYEKVESHCKVSD